MSLAHSGFTPTPISSITASVTTDLVNGTSTATITFSTTGMISGDTIIVVFRQDGVTAASASITSYGGTSVALATRANGLVDTLGVASFKCDATLLSGGGTRNLVLSTTGGLHAHLFKVTGSGQTFTQGTLQGITNGAPLSVTASGVSGNQFLVCLWNATGTTAGTPASVTNSLTADATTGTQVGVVADLCIETASTTASLSSDTGTGQMIAACWFTS